MLTGLRIGNFKAFAETQRIPLRPLTLVYGPNSAGKSSILHSLLLAHHALDKGDLDVHRMPISGDSVDLGGFRQYVHRRDVNRRMEWAAEIDVSQLRGRPGCTSTFMTPTSSIRAAASCAWRARSASPSANTGASPWTPWPAPNPTT